MKNKKINGACQSNAYEYPSNVKLIYELVREKDDANISTIFVNEISVLTNPSIFNPFVRIDDQINGNLLDEKLFETYKEISNQYSAGDELFFIGFSRGAFTVRVLVNFIRRYGILKSLVIGADAHNDYIIRRKIREFCDHNAVEYKLSGFAGVRSISRINNEYFYHVDSIQFVGLFDTVSGISKEKENKYDYFIYPEFVNKSCHIMAYNVTSVFRNISYHCFVKNRGENRCLDGSTEDNNHEESWIQGDHGDIGGGHIQNPRTCAALSNKALKKMLSSLTIKIDLLETDYTENNIQHCNFKFKQINFQILR
jgi:uncharacterized protein (DUF2235 family)